MGLDSTSPAHRRNQNPMSPSASLFKRSTTFPREEIDLSWMALLRRHRFLLLMLVLLTFLCTVYLYFAMKLGNDHCSGLASRESVLCRLRRSKLQASSHIHGSKRALLGMEDFKNMEGPSSGTLMNMDTLSWVEYMITIGKIRKILGIGCKDMHLNELFTSEYVGAKLAFACQMGATNSTTLLHDLILCGSCDKQDLESDSRKMAVLSQQIRDGGYLLWIAESLNEYNDRSHPYTLMKIPGFTSLSRSNGMAIWQRALL